MWTHGTTISATMLFVQAGAICGWLCHHVTIVIYAPIKRVWATQYNLITFVSQREGNIYIYMNEDVVNMNELTEQNFF